MFLSESDPMVRLFRLEPASPAEVTWFLAGVGSAIAAVVLWSIVHHRKGKRRRRAAETRSLEAILAGARFDSSDRLTFGAVVRASGASPVLCATSVEDFDRGVKAILADAASAGRGELLLAIRSVRRKLGLHLIRKGRPVLSTRALPSDLVVQVSVAGGPRDGCPAAGILLSADEEALTVRLEGSGEASAKVFREAEAAEVFFIQPLDACYIFRSRVICMKEAGATLLVLEHPPSLQRLQKRAFVRVDIREDVRLQRIADLRTPGPDPGSARPEGASGVRAGRITSLSGGGACLETDLPLAPEDLLQLSLPFLPEPSSRDPFFARVIRSKGASSYGIRFEGMGPSAQAAVLQFVRREEARRAREGGEAPAGGEGRRPNGQLEVTLR